MTHFDPNATIQTPVRADGDCIKNVHGEIIARMTNSNSFATHAICELINLGSIEAEKVNEEYRRREMEKLRMFCSINKIAK